MKQQDQIEIYQDKESGITIKVKPEGESLWFYQYQIAHLFDTD